MSTRELIEEANPHLRQYLVSLDDFTIGRSIGEGAFGKVYLGTHKATGLECAIKELIAETLEDRDKVEFIRETSVLAECNDMFLLPFLGWTAEKPYSIITQFAPNGSLFDALRKKGKAPELTGTMRTIIMIGVARAMNALHQKKVIHRDLKSLNVLLDSRCYPWVCDFGLSLFENENAIKTKDIGTPHWMAPELFDSDNYTNKVDVYAYGILLWELLTGSTPYKGKSSIQIAIAVCQHGERPPIPIGTPKPLISLIKSCWHQDPNKRPSFSKIVSVLMKKQVMFRGTEEAELDEFFNNMKEYDALKASGQAVGSYPLGNPLYIASMCQGISENSTESQKVANPSELGNPNYKYYIENIKLCVKLYTGPENIRRFYDMLIPALVGDKSEDCRVSNAILNTCYRLMLKQDYCFNAFFQSKLFGTLPTNKQNCTNNIYDILHLYFERRPDLIETDLLYFISPLTQFAPHKMLKLISFNLNNFGQYMNGWQVANYYLMIAPTMIRSTSGDKYIKYLIYLMTKYPNFNAQYKMMVVQILIAAIQQFRPDISNLAYSYLIKLQIPKVSIAPEVILKSLSTQGCESGAISYLLLTDPSSFAFTPQIIDQLITLCSTNKSTYALLYIIGQRNDCFTFFFPDYVATWLIDGRLPLDKAMILMAIIMCHTEYRPYIAHVRQLPDWLALLAQTLNMTTISFTSMMIDKLSIPKNLIPKLNAAGYFKAYIDNTIKLSDPKLLQSTIYMIDAASRIMYIPDFKKFDTKLVEVALSDDSKLSIGALSALTMRSLRPEGAAEVKSLERLSDVMKKFETVENARPFLDLLQKNFASA